MVGPRTVEDQLRSEYADLLSTMHRTRLAIETEVQHALLPVTLGLDQYERITVRARLKDCESALDALRRRQDFGLFDTEHPEQYSLTTLPDLVGVRVLAFPHHRIEDARQALLPLIQDWVSDPVPSENGEDSPIAFKYAGHWDRSGRVRSEIQIVSLLIGLFWEAEHAAIYKPTPNLRGVAKSLEMKQRTGAVITALKEFELEFSRLIESATENESLNR